MSRNLIKLLFPVSCFAIILGCAAPFTAQKPKGFAEYPGGNVHRSVSSDGVVYRVSQLENEPFAEFPFWHEALRKRTVDAGYRLVSDTVLTIDKKEFALVELLAPLGSTDYSYLIGMSVVNKKIIVAESAGEVKNVQEHKTQIISAMQEIKSGR